MNDTLDFSIVDVFTRTPFSGNPVAVIHDASNLNSAQMQLIAREFGYSESTFILPPNDDLHTAAVRIFTPLEEVPFAGHPNIGTALVIAIDRTCARVSSAREFLFEEVGGLVSVRSLRDSKTVIGAAVVAPQPVKVLGSVSKELMAECLGIPNSGIRSTRLSPCVASVGLAFGFVELTNVGILSKIEPNIAAFRLARDEGLETVDGFAVCAFVATGYLNGRTKLRARVVCPFGHPQEDPATGSASAALCALVARDDRDNQLFTVVQGVEMKRPSEIDVKVTPKTPPVVSGRCIRIAKGSLVAPETEMRANGSK